MPEYIDVSVPSPGINPDLRSSFKNYPTSPTPERIVGEVVPDPNWQPLGMRTTFETDLPVTLTLTETGAGSLTVTMDGVRYFDGNELIRALVQKAKAETK